MLFSHRFLPSATLTIGIVLGLAAFSGGAMAQTPYVYPQGGYRGVTGEDGVVTIAPEDDERQPGGRATNAPYQQPYPAQSYPSGDQPQVQRQALPAPAGSQAQPSSYYSGAASGDQAPTNSDPAQKSAPQPGFPFPPIFGAPAPSDAPRPPAAIDAQRAPGTPAAPANVAALPPEDQPEEEPKELPPQFKRQVVDYITKEPAGTIIVDTSATYLYLVLGNGKAMRYGIGVGREGFTWSGVERITRTAEWPDWYPPSEMIERQPYLPRFMAGGPGNPLGARALYLGKTVYRIHGTNQPSTIGKFVSSGCIRLVNDDIEDLYSRVKVGTRVVVLPGGAPSASNTGKTQ
jgi:lipoprotein-anchoring transpeptidase ErfK/SrfK